MQNSSQYDVANFILNDYRVEISGAKKPKIKVVLGRTEMNMPRYLREIPKHQEDAWLEFSDENMWDKPGMGTLVIEYIGTTGPLLAKDFHRKGQSVNKVIMSVSWTRISSTAIVTFRKDCEVALLDNRTIPVVFTDYRGNFICALEISKIKTCDVEGARELMAETVLRTTQGTQTTQ